MMGVNTRNIYSCLQECNLLNKSHLVGKLLNSIHDARTHVYKTPLHVSSTVVLIFRRKTVLTLHLVSSLSLGDCSVYRLREE